MVNQLRGCNKREAKRMERGIDVYRKYEKEGPGGQVNTA